MEDLCNHTGRGPVWAVGASLGQVLEVRVAVSLSGEGKAAGGGVEAAAAAAAAAAETSGTESVVEAISSWSSSLSTAARTAAPNGVGTEEDGVHGEQVPQPDLPSSHPPLHVCYSLAITRAAPPAVPTSTSDRAAAANGAGASGADQGRYGTAGVSEASRRCVPSLHSNTTSQMMMISSSSSSSSSRSGVSSSAIDEGVIVVSGASHNVHVGVLPGGRPHWQPFLLSFTQPGL